MEGDVNAETPARAPCVRGKHVWRVEHDTNFKVVLFACSRCGQDPFEYLLTLEVEMDTMTKDHQRRKGDGHAR